MFPQLDEMDQKLDNLAREIAADQRRLDAMKADCPEYHSEVQDRVAALNSAELAPAPDADAVTDAAGLVSRLANMDEEAFLAVEQAVADERNRRQARFRQGS
jgi:chromosome segregation ATPase